MSASATASEQVFWREYREKLGVLRGDTSGWEEYVEESAGLEVTLADGLEWDEDWGWLSDAANAGLLELEDD